MSFLKKQDSNNDISWDEGKEKSFLREAGEFIIEIAKLIVIALAIIIPVRYFLIQPFYVKGASMEPNFYDHEYLIINEISYRLDSPERGDIIVFRYPRDPSQYFIKRIIGLPGEKVELQSGRVFIFNKENQEGQAIKEDLYLSSSIETRDFGNKIFELKNNEYFVLGDNRNSSRDSRDFGPVDKSLIVGRVWVRGWPFNRMAIFESPKYNF
jgi:signal peptidase I